MNCSSCGAAMPAESRFCPECGAPTFAPPEAVAPPEGGAPPVAPPPTMPDAASAPAVAPEHPSEKKRVPTLVKVGVPVVLVVGAGALAYTFLSGSSDEGTGAETPEAAVQAMATSLDEDDLLGMLTVMAPDEVGPLSDVFDAALAKSGELELLEVTDNGLAELDVNVDGLALETTELHPEVVKVTISGGSIGADFTSPDLGLALVSEDEVQFATSEEMEGEEELAGLTEDTDIDETFVVTVQHDGEWYVSPLYTLAEYLRESEDLGDPDFAASRGEVQGAESPVAAVQAAAAAIEGLDIEAGAAVLPPGEFGIARDYLDLILDEIDEDDLEEEREELELAVDNLELTEGEELGDGRRQVIIESFDFSYRDEYDDETVEGRFEGLCVETDDNETCLAEGLADGRTDPILAELAPDAVYVVAVEGDGGWYVSPMETLAAYLTDAIETLDERHLAAVGLVEPQAYIVGEPADGELVSPFARAAFTFDVEEGTTYVATITSDTDFPMRAAIHPVGGYAYGEGGARAIEGSFGGPGVFTAADASYAMAIGVDLYDVDTDEAVDGGAVPFTVTITELAVEDELEAGEPVEVDIDAGATVAFSFEGQADDEILPVFEGEGLARLVDPTGYDTPFEDGQTEFLYESGEYLVVVTATDDDEFTVGFEIGGSEPDPDPDPEPSELLIEPPDSLDGIDEIPLGEVQRVTLAEEDIIDFTFVGTGGEMSVVAAGDDDLFDPILVVFDEDLNPVVENEGDPVERRAESVIDTEEGVVYVVSVAGYQFMGGDVRIVVEEA